MCGQIDKRFGHVKIQKFWKPFLRKNRPTESIHCEKLIVI